MKISVFLYVLLVLSMVTEPAFARIDPWIRISSKGDHAHVEGGVPDKFIPQLKRAKEISLSFISDDDLAKVCSACRPDRLYICSNKLTSIAPVADLSNLKYFELLVNNVKDMSPLAKLTGLKTLRVWGKEAKGPIFKLISDMTNLDVIDIWTGENGKPKISINYSTNWIHVYNGVTDEYIYLMKKTRSHPRFLILENISDTDLAKICSAIPEIYRLEIKSKKLTSIAPVAGLTNLKLFFMEAANVRDMSPLAKLTGLKEWSIK